ncbi:MAG: carbonic anhydrase [Methylacidiphilales bacterium]|nr:carbonic anhydrase [Candidatus Methylacidiphilales bacterium]
MCAICGNLSDDHAPIYSRRNFLRLMGGAAAGLTLSSRALFAAGETPKPQNVLTPDQALARLKEGNERYISGVMKRHDFAAERAALAGGQNPFAGILSCADSRIAPEFAFDSGRGDLFVVRVAGNFTNDDAIASFEYAVKFLGTTLLVVLGHDKCGAVDAAIKTVKDGAELPGHLPQLVEHLRPAVKAALADSKDKPDSLLADAIRENVRLNVENLKSASPILSQCVADGKIGVVGGIYKLKDGRIDWL